MNLSFRHGTPEIVGESFHADELASLVEDHRDEMVDEVEDEDLFEEGDYAEVPVEIELRAEQNNRYDKNAIAVYVDDVHVGHLRRDHAALYRPELERIGGLSTGHRGTIRGSEGIYGVFL